MKSTIEKFKPINGYEGLYEVSDYGTVRSLDYQGKKRIKYLRNIKAPDGYERINLYRDGKMKRLLVHRLVYEAFVGEIPEGYEIDHINTIRDDNRLSNLRVVTRKGNMANQITAERHQEATREAAKRRSQDPKWLEAVREANRNRCNKPVHQLDKQTDEIIRRWDCASDVERELGINYQNISSCCHGKQKSAGGFKWRFASD